MLAFLSVSVFVRTVFVRKYHGLSALCFFLIVAAGMQIANAQVDTRWIAGDGNWSDAANWDNGVPIGNFNAIIDSAAGTIVQDVGTVEIDGMVLNSPTARLVLDNPLIIENLDWQAGEIGGSEELTLIDTGQIIGEVTLETTINNTGFMKLGAGNSQSGRVSGVGAATWNNRPGSILELVSGSRFGRFVNNGMGQLNIETNSLVVFGPSFATSENTWDFVNEGAIEIIDSTVFFVSGYEQRDSGSLILDGGITDFGVAPSVIQGKVSGVGILSTIISFDAVLEPGGDEIGTINVGFFPMTPTAVANFQIGPGLTSDTVTHNGNGLQLNGTLNIEALPGATAGIYTLFTTVNGLPQGIENIQLGDVPAGFQGSLFLDVPDRSIKLDVQAIAPIVLLGDVNLDGVVNLLDVADFVALLASGQFQAEADINEDGSVNLLDVNGFVQLLAG